MPDQARGWRTRGRLPHADFTGLTQAVTFRLADALPTDVLTRLQHQVVEGSPRSALEERRAQLLRERIHAWLDAGHGAGVLGREAARAALADELHRHDGAWYRLDAYSIMPNHVHALLVVGKVPLGKIVQAWKGASARSINLALGRSGTLWGREYLDRFIRGEGHMVAALRYIQQNAVRAGLVQEAEEWPGLWVSDGMRAWMGRTTAD